MCFEANFELVSKNWQRRKTGRLSVKELSDNDSPTKKLFKELFKELLRGHFIVELIIAPKANSIWYLDSVVIYHMTFDRKAFFSYENAIIKNEI
jgi:hypothetical protein